MIFLKKLLISTGSQRLLQNESWAAIWNEQERNQFLFAARLLFAVTTLVYIFHYFTVDQIEGLAPSVLWFNYRFSMAGISLLAFLFYVTPALYKTKYYKIPLVIACAIFTFFQAKTVLWYPKVPYLYVYGFIFMSTILTRSSILRSIVHSLLLSILSWTTLIEAGQRPAMLASATVVTLIFVVFIRARYLSDIHLFIANQVNLEQQKQLIELSLESKMKVAISKAEMAKKVAHDIRSPLSALNSLLNSVADINSPQKQIIEQVVSRINGIADDLLATERTDALLRKSDSKASLELALQSLVAEKQIEFQHDKRIEISLHTHDLSPDAVISISNKKIQRILSNLINNAVEAVETNGHILVVAQSFPRQITFAVVDFGRGIPESILAKLNNHEFASFGKEGLRASGSGLGLRTAFEEIKAHGGDLQIDSKENMGTQVTIKMPPVCTAIKEGA